MNIYIIYMEKSHTATYVIPRRCPSEKLWGLLHFLFTANTSNQLLPISWILLHANQPVPHLRCCQSWLPTLSMISTFSNKTITGRKKKEMAFSRKFFANKLTTLKKPAMLLLTPTVFYFL